MHLRLGAFQKSVNVEKSVLKNTDLKYIKCQKIVCTWNSNDCRFMKNNSINMRFLGKDSEQNREL